MFCFMALMSIRDLPAEQKKSGEKCLIIISLSLIKTVILISLNRREDRLGEIDESLNRKIRSLLLKKINRIN